MTNTFYIEFDTREFEPFLKGISVTLSTEVIRDLKRQLPINLSEHPLYPALVRYVQANPPRQKKESSNGSSE